MRVPVLAAIAFAALCTTAEAVTISDCNDLPAALTVSGSTVTLQQGLVCTGNYTITGTGMILEGAGTGATFNTTGGGRALTGNAVGALTIRNLTFTSSDGARGGVSLTGATVPTIDDVLFRHNGGVAQGGGLLATVAGRITIADSTFGFIGDANSATTAGGGAYLSSTNGSAIEIARTAFSGNSTTSATNGSGGGLSATTTGPVTVDLANFTANVVAPTNSGSGGGAAISGLTVTLTDTSFSANQVRTVNGYASAQGGGLALAHGSTTTPAVLRRNVFNNNAVVASPSPATGGFVAGGGAVIGGAAALERDTWTDNALPQNGSASFTWGAALAQRVSFCGSAVTTLRNEFFNGNAIADSGDGTYFFAADCAHAAQLDNVTLRNNAVGSGAAAGAALSGVAGSTLVVTNSLFWGDTGAPELAATGGTVSARASDVCSGGAPFTGPGNICADPLFANGFVVVVPANSPVVDKGDNALVPADLTTSFTSGPRILDGNGDCTATVDMGAAELADAGASCPPPSPPAQTTPTTPATPSSPTGPTTPVPTPAPPITNPGQVLLCAGHRVILIDVRRSAGRVTASGLAVTSLAGKRIVVTGDHGAGRRTARVAADGSFSVRFGRPRSGQTSYTAVYGKDRSSPLKLTRNLDVVAQKKTAGGLRIVARHSRGRRVSGQKVTIRRQLGCDQQTVAGTLTFDRRGRVTTVLPAPTGADTIAVYRLTTKTNNTFTLPIVVRR